jgi:hypothetical protein
MHIDAIHAGQSALALALAAQITATQSDSRATRADWLPFIGVGTFLVATYLRSNLCPPPIRDNNRAGP